MKIFSNKEAKLKFIEIYESLSYISQTKFAEMIREKADEKITSLENLDDFYLTEDDIKTTFINLQNTNNI